MTLSFQESFAKFSISISPCAIPPLHRDVVPALLGPIKRATSDLAISDPLCGFFSAMIFLRHKNWATILDCYPVWKFTETWHPRQWDATEFPFIDMPETHSRTLFPHHSLFGPMAQVGSSFFPWPNESQKQTEHSLAPWFQRVVPWPLSMSAWCLRPVPRVRSRSDLRLVLVFWVRFFLQIRGCSGR